MELIPIECGNCKAKLKIKAMPARMPTEVKCPKCGKPIPVGKGAPAASAPTPAAAPATPSIPTPVASKPIIPVVPPPVTPITAPPAAPASSTAQLTSPPKAINQPTASSPVSTPKKAAAPIVLGQVPEASSGANISVICPACQWQTKVSQTLIGKKIKCKQCSGIIPVLSPEQASTSDASNMAPFTTPPPAPIIPTEAPAPAPVIPSPIPPSPAPETPKITTQVVPVLPQEVAPPPTPVAQWTAPETNYSTTLSTSTISPGTTVLVGEIATLKSKLESAIKESTLSSIRVAEADKKVQEADKRVQNAELRVHEAENTLHALAGKSAIDAMNANRRITELEAMIAPLQARIGLLTQSLEAVAAEFGPELDQAEKIVARLKAILSARNPNRTT